MQAKYLLIATLLAGSTICMAQQVLTNETVVKMHAAGLGDDIIISTVKSQLGNYETGADALIALKSSGISDAVINALIAKRTEGTQPSPEPIAPSSTANAPPPPSAQTTPTEPIGKPRIYLQAISHGPNQNAARDQSMEMSRDFERGCPEVRISINQQMADYTVVLNHIEVGLIVRDNQFQIADRNGDLISKTKEGGSIASGVKKACQFILADWAKKTR